MTFKFNSKSTALIALALLILKIKTKTENLIKSKEVEGHEREGTLVGGPTNRRAICGRAREGDLVQTPICPML